MLGRSEKISIVTTTEVDDGFGGVTPGAESVVLETFAKVSQKGASAEVIAKYPDMIGICEFEILYRQDVEIKSSHLLKWRGRTYSIVDLMPDLVRKRTIKIIGKASNKTTDNGEV